MDISSKICHLEAKLMFMGAYDPTKAYQTGDVVTIGDEALVFDGVAFQLLGKPDEPKDIRPDKPIRIKCSSCGAPLKGCVCEYCGSTYRG